MEIIGLEPMAPAFIVSTEKNLRQFTVQDGLADNQVINIQEDDMGNIWLQSGMFSITKFDGTKFTLQSDKSQFYQRAESDWKAKTTTYGFTQVVVHSDSAILR